MKKSLTLFIVAISLVPIVLLTYIAVQSHRALFRTQADSRPSYMSDPYNWKPDVLGIKTASKSIEPSLNAVSAIAMNLDTDEVYYAKNPERKLPMASLTKIMTALLTLENNKPNDLFTVSKKAANTGENSMGISEGEKYTVSELIWGLMLHSGNDAAEALGENVAGNRIAFTKLMNKRAKELGLENTRYTNASGLDGDGEMHTTVKDLAIISKYILSKYPDILNITKTIDYVLPKSEYHKEIVLSSEIDLVRTYPGTIGFKTGFNDEAQYCIVTVTENEGHKILVIVLGSANRKIDAVKLLDYSYEQLGIQIKHVPFW